MYDHSGSIAVDAIQRQTHITILIWLCALTLTVIGLAPGAADSATVVVDTTSDNANGNTSSIPALQGSMGDDGVISLREAITAANNTLTGSAPNEIHFNITGAGPHTIQPTFALPPITNTVIIDGTTEPDYTTTPVIELDGSMAGAVIGLYLANGSDGSTIRARAINRFSGDGMEIANGADSNTIVGNFIGTDVTGTMAGFGNGGVGIFVTSDLNIIGGSGADQNLISGNTSDGININSGSKNRIAGNWIGVDVTGASALGNGGDGIQLSAADANHIGDAVSGLGNVISANGGYGVWVVGSAASDNVITSNLIGLNATGTSALTNTNDGIYFSSAPNNTVGGLTANARNVIAAPFGKVSIDISGTLATGNVIQGNYIGTDINGTTRLVAGSFGIRVSGVANTTIGGTASGAGNVVAGYSVTGLHFSGNLSGSTVQGNFIGTDTSGTLDLTTGIYGIGLQNSISNVTIGGIVSGAGNVIAFHSQNGIKVWPTAGTGLGIQQNQIYSNGQLGIEIDATGVTDNDTGDNDTGPNNLQNFPVLTSAATDGSRVALRGWLNSTAATTFRLEFFANTTADASGHGEGERYLGSVNVTTDAGTGDATFLRIFPVAVTAGEFISATATDPGQNTSEFALNVTALADADSDGDGVLDSIEDRNLDGDNNPATGSPVDTDGDTIPDYLDPDDDGDSVLTADENLNDNGDPTDDDSDGDGIPDYLDPDDAGPGAGDSDMDGVDDDVECPSRPFCTDTDGDGIPNYNDPDHMTDVSNISLKTIATGAGVWVLWTTDHEVDNLGFHVYRKAGDAKAQITTSLIAGSALLTGAGKEMPSSHTYAWFDAAGTAGDHYWIADVDIHRVREPTFYGPATPKAKTATKTAWVPSPLLAGLGQNRFQPSRSAPPDQTQVRYHKPTVWVTTPLTPTAWEALDLTPEARQQALAATSALNLVIDKAGWYRVTQPELVRAGLAPTVDSRDLQLYAAGRQVVLEVESERQNRLGPDDAIAFYAEPLNTPFTDRQRYWLVVGSKPGKRLHPTPSIKGQPTAPSFPFTATYQPRTVYIPAVQNGDEENFFGPVIATETVEAPLYLTSLAPMSAATAQVAVALQGVTPVEHRVDIHVNSHRAGEMALGAFTCWGRVPSGIAPRRGH